MQTLKSHILALAALLTSVSGPAWAQHDNHSAVPTSENGMAMSMKTLLMAQLDARQVVDGSVSKATGTGAFILDSMQRSLEYQLTYQGLESDRPQSIALYNFGEGKVGAVTYVLCSDATTPCPKTASATISGTVKPGLGKTIDNELIGEFDSARMYVEIVGGDGAPEIRGQLAPNDSQVTVVNYVAHLKPRGGGTGSGTAIVSETHLPEGKVLVHYAATVAGTSGTPTGAALASQSARGNNLITLPKVEVRLSRDRETGGSLAGVFEADRASPEAAFPSKAIAADLGKGGFTVTSVQSPDGELYGDLLPVK